MKRSSLHCHPRQVNKVTKAYVVCLPHFWTRFSGKKVTIWEAISAQENKNWLYMSVWTHIWTCLRISSYLNITSLQKSLWCSQTVCSCRVFQFMMPCSYISVVASLHLWLFVLFYYLQLCLASKGGQLLETWTEQDSQPGTCAFIWGCLFIQTQTILGNLDTVHNH